MAEALRMSQIRLHTPRVLARARHLGIDLDRLDLGYLVHCYLRALFGDAAPQPFHAVESPGPRVEVLGYGRASRHELEDRQATFAEPELVEAVDSLAVKDLPGEWAEGRRLGFEVRACPVVRLKRGERQAGPTELDAFLRACQLADAGRGPGDPKVPVERHEVYRDWLVRQLGQAAELESASLDGFRRVRLVRRTQGTPRQPRVLERPDALLRGVLKVKDGDAFGRLLARGVGRHRAFGFGMLRLRPA